jgi:zinc protease
MFQKIKHFALFSLLLISVSCVIRFPAFADDPAQTLTTLPNGLRVISAPSHAAPIVAIDVWVKAGASRQTPSEKGVAHYLEHVLFKGTPTRKTEEDIDGAIENLGGTLNGATSYDWAHFYVVVPSQNFEAALDVLSDVMQHSEISKVDVEDERPVILGELARGLNNPIELIAGEARMAAYGPNHPYGSAITGAPRDVKNVTQEQIENYYHKWYVPNNVSLVVTGDVDGIRVSKAAEKDFASWTFSPDLEAEPKLSVQPMSGVRRTVIERNVSQSYMAIGMFAPSVDDRPDVWVMDVAMTLLGQGGNNWLDIDLREKRSIVNAITSDYLTQKGAGLLVITCSFPSGNPDEVEDAIIAEVNRLGNKPISPNELASAKQSLIASYLFDAETDSGKADALGFYDMIDSYQYDVDYIKHIQDVTTDDVQNLAKKYLVDHSYSIATIIPYSSPAIAKIENTDKNIHTASSN